MSEKIRRPEVQLVSAATSTALVEIALPETLVCWPAAMRRSPVAISGAATSITPETRVTLTASPALRTSNTVPTAVTRASPA
ncbi:hypothetical protein D3C73_1052700 [compost metagenome]